MSATNCVVPVETTGTYSSTGNYDPAVTYGALQYIKNGLMLCDGKLFHNTGCECTKAPLHCDVCKNGCNSTIPTCTCAMTVRMDPKPPPKKHKQD